MKKLILLIFLTSCISPNSNQTNNVQNFDFNKDLNFSEFRELLIRYTDASSYPDIDK